MHTKDFLGGVPQANYLHVATSRAALRHKELCGLVEGMVHLNRNRFQLILVTQRASAKVMKEPEEPNAG